MPPKVLPTVATKSNELLDHAPKAIAPRTASELNGSSVAARNEARNKPTKLYSTHIGPNSMLAN